MLTTNNIMLYIWISVLILCCSGCNRNNEKPKPPPPRVTTAIVQKQEVPIYVDAIGQVISPVTVNIRPQAAGKLIKANIKQGAIVEEGDILYEIDPRPYQAILDQANAQLSHDQALLAYAEQAVARYKKVVEDDYISVLNFEQFQSNAHAARAQVEQDIAAIVAAQINLDFCKVVAPVSGKISYSNVDVGNILVVDDPNQITVIRPFSPIDISFAIPQQQFEMIRQVQGNEGDWKFIATLPEQPDHPFDGTTYFLDNQVDQNTGTILLKGRVANEERKLWPGEFIRVKVLYNIAPDALTAPLSSVLIGKDGPYVYVLDSDKKASVKSVVVLTRTNEFAALHSSELQAGDTVVVDGQINLAPGILVTEVSDRRP